MDISEKVVVMTDLPKKNKAPFLIFVNKAIPYQELWEKTHTTIIYIADDNLQRKEMEQLNANQNAFIVNPQIMSESYYYTNSLGSYLEETLLDDIKDAQRRGNYDINKIVTAISNSIKEVRDEILFAPHLRSYKRISNKYNELQTKYRFIPQMMFLSDPALKAACPLADCLSLTSPHEGCCGSSNMPEILIEFAIKYRKIVGETEFQKQLESHSKRKKVEPWYIHSEEYIDAFRNTAEDLIF